METPLVPLSGQWKLLKESDGQPKRLPYVTVSGFAYDKFGNFVALHRSNAVRSAKDAWSIPSGIHEIGLTMAQQFKIELHEELNLDGDLSQCRMVGCYENIACIDDYHWVIAIMAMPIGSFECMKNREPDKHDIVEIVPVSRILDDVWLKSRHWTPGLMQAMFDVRNKVADIVFKH